MFKLILYKELREIIGSTKFAVTFGICSILIILAFFSGIKNYQTGMEEYEASKAAALRQYEKETEWTKVNSLQIFLTPEPLMSLIMGISNDLGRTSYVNGRNKPEIYDSNYSQQPVFAVFRYLDLEFVFQVVLSLFAILFAFDAINGEKERGTLRLSFVNSIPRATYILGKITGSFLALALPLLIPILIGILLLPLMGIVLSADEWIRLTFFIVCGLLYLGVFLTLSVFVSGLTQRSSSSFLFLLVIWVFSVLIVPRASVIIAGNMIEVPSKEEISIKVMKLQQQQSIESEQKLKELYRNYFQALSKNSDPEASAREEKKLQESLEKMLTERTKKREDFSSRLKEERRNIQSGQEKLAFGISRISPTAVFSLASTTLSGTSLELRDHYQKTAEAFSSSFADFYFEKTGFNIGNPLKIMLAMNKKEKSITLIDTSEIPEFVYQAPELSFILKDALPDTAILILFNFIFFAGAFVSFMRYDLR